MDLPPVGMVMCLEVYQVALRGLTQLHRCTLDLHQLLPTVLLYWAAHRPGGRYDSSTHQAVVGCFLALNTWAVFKLQANMVRQEGPRQEQEAAAVEGIHQRMPALRPSVLDEALPLLLLQLSRLQQQQPAVDQATSGGGTAGEAHGEQQQHPLAAASSTSPLPPTVQNQHVPVGVLSYLCACSPEVTRPGAAATAEAPSGTDAAPRLIVHPSQHCASIFKVLEAYLRATAAQDSEGNLETLLQLVVLFKIDPKDPCISKGLLRYLPALAAESGSDAQNRLLSPLRTFLKVRFQLPQQDRVSVVLTCADAASYMLRCQAGSSDAPGSAADSSSSSSSRLAWLHVLGHCFIQWSAELQQVVATFGGLTPEVVAAMVGRNQPSDPLKALGSDSPQPCLSSSDQQQLLLQQQQQQQ